MSIDRLFAEVINNIKKSDQDMVEAPLRVLANILFTNQRVTADQIYNELVKMKIKYATMDYVIVMAREPMVRFYMIEPEEDAKLIAEEKDDGGTTSSRTD